jgi:hypothetical protein
MFDHLNGIIQALAKKMADWLEDFFIAMKLARQNLSKYCPEVTPTRGMLHITAENLNYFRKLRSFRKWDKGIDINPEDKTSYTTYFKVAFLKYTENECCTKHRCVPVNTLENMTKNNHIPSALASGSNKTSFDQYDLSSSDEDYLIPNNRAESTTG